MPRELLCEHRCRASTRIILQTRKPSGKATRGQRKINSFLHMDLVSSTSAAAVIVVSTVLLVSMCMGGRRDERMMTCNEIRKLKVSPLDVEYCLLRSSFSTAVLGSLRLQSTELLLLLLLSYGTYYCPFLPTHSYDFFIGSARECCGFFLTVPMNKGHSSCLRARAEGREPRKRMYRYTAIVVQKCTLYYTMLLVLRQQLNEQYPP